MKLIRIVLLFIIVLTLSACGLDGVQGMQGEQGEQGIQGEQGLQGEQGVQGDVGLTGDQGLQGEQGIPGLNGEDGLSAYELWITIPGNESKTMNEFFDSLVGSVDAAIIDELQEDIYALQLMNDVHELKDWILLLPNTYMTGDVFPYDGIPALTYGSLPEETSHIFAYYTGNDTVSITLFNNGQQHTLMVLFELVMNQEEIDAMNLQLATENANVIQAWLDAMSDDYIHGDTLPSLPMLPNPGLVAGSHYVTFNYYTQNGDVIFTVNIGGQFASASRDFTIGEEFQSLLMADAVYLQNWLNSRDGTPTNGDELSTPPQLPNGSIITSGYPHEFSFSNETVTLTIENGPYQTTITRTFDVQLF